MPTWWDLGLGDQNRELDLENDDGDGILGYIIFGSDAKIDGGQKRFRIFVVGFQYLEMNYDFEREDII